MELRALIALGLATVMSLSCNPFENGKSDSSGADPDSWVGKWRGTGAYVITATNTKPITGSTPVELTIQKSDKANAIRIVGADGKGYDLFLDPSHPDTASTGDAIKQHTAVTDANGRYEATAKLTKGRIHMVQTSWAHGRFHFDQLHGDADAKTVTTIDLDRAK